VVAAVQHLAEESIPLRQNLEELREEGHKELPHLAVPPPAAIPPPENKIPPKAVRSVTELKPSAVKWTPRQTEALAKVIAVDQSRRVWIGSLEITELIRRQLREELSSITAAELSRGQGPGQVGAVSGVSSPAARLDFGKGRGFWFNVNAELVIYGATERGAKLIVGGRAVALRPDGTFSFRFALPDGNYDLPITAVAPDGQESRQADLSFRRASQYRGDVGRHPQDAKLREPAAAHVG
jgi:hypothetical protein